MLDVYYHETIIELGRELTCNWGNKSGKYKRNNAYGLMPSIRQCTHQSTIYLKIDILGTIPT